MGLEEGIRKRGFRKWYERELIQSHLHLVLTFVCAVGLLAAFEAHDRGSPWSQQLMDAGAVLLLSAVGIWALRRYLYLLTHAESVAHQAVCPNCDTYARLKLVPHQRVGGEVRVRCAKCDHEWGIVD